MKPDVKRLNALCGEAERLQEEGKLSPDAYERILEQAREAANGHGDELEPFLIYAPDEWLAEHFPALRQERTPA